MYWNEIFFYMWFVLIFLLLIKYFVYLIKKGIIKRNYQASKKYENDRLELVDENGTKMKYNKYQSNSSELVENYYIYEKDNKKLLGIKFNEIPKVKNLIIYEYNIKQKLINIINLNDFNYKNDSYEFLINKKTEFINIETTNKNIIIKNKKFSWFDYFIDTLLSLVITLIASNFLLKYTIGNLSDNFIDYKLEIISFMLVVFTLVNLFFFRLVYIKRNKKSGVIVYE